MKSYIIIGLGRFGAEMAVKLYECGEDVLAVDQDEALVDKIADRVTRAVAADARDADVLKKLGAGNFDRAVVAVGSDPSTMSTPSYLKTKLSEVSIVTSTVPWPSSFEPSVGASWDAASEAEVASDPPFVSAVFVFASEQEAIASATTSTSTSEPIFFILCFSFFPKEHSPRKALVSAAFSFAYCRMICPEFQSAICHISLLLFPLGFVRLAVLFFRRSTFFLRSIFFLFQDLFPGSLLCEVPFLLLMDIRYILKSTATVIVFGTEFPAVDQTEESINYILLKLGSGVLFNDRDHFFEVHAFSVRTVGIHRIEGIRHGDDLRDTRDILSLKSPRISMPVRSLVVVSRTDRKLRHDADILKHCITFSGMRLDLVKFFVRQTPRLVERIPIFPISCRSAMFLYFSTVSSS